MRIVFLSVVLPRHPWAHPLMSLIEPNRGSKRACGQLNKSRRICRIQEDLRFGAEKIFASREEKNC